MRRPIIAGNWKMNMTLRQAQELVEGILPLVADAATEVVVCPNFTCLAAVAKIIEGTNVRLGAQNMYYEEKGAFTGETSPDMLLDVGVEYVILGHSERRQYFGETDLIVNKKVLTALAHGISPIICLGETEKQRDAGKADEVVRAQTKAALVGVSAKDIDNFVMAYEPIWAIGTGKSATSQEANDTIGVIRSALEGLFGPEGAQRVRIQYGGSMNPKNCAELMAQPEIDGGLIGGAALKPADFAAIVRFDK